MESKKVYLMRGLPCCGKSRTARQLAGPTGLVLETDEFFYKHVGDDPQQYDYSEEGLEQAREWNFQRFITAIDEGVTPIVVDRGNSRSRESQRYVRYAVEHGYDVELKEPQWELWQGIRVLLQFRPQTNKILYHLADWLAARSSPAHRVPASLIQRGMDQWELDLTVSDILEGTQPSKNTAR